MVANTTDRLTARLSARERLLAAADELFYEEGVHTVGIDRVIERAGVAKASLYNTFGSKEELIRSYLLGRQESRQERVTRALARHDNPRDQLLAVFDVLGEVFTQPGYRGCAFVNASAESPPGGPVQRICDDLRGWIRTLFARLCQEAGVADPEHLAVQLVLLYDGAIVGAQMDRDPGRATAARNTAAVLIDAATG
jgi:AcrR family transcriptional regulator